MTICNLRCCPAIRVFRNSRQSCRRLALGPGSSTHCFGLRSSIQSDLSRSALAYLSTMAKDQDEEMKEANGGENGKKEQANAKKDKKKGAEKPELSEEDLELKANLEMIVERISDADPAVQSSALDNISREIRSATTSMTSVPKPLKFLRPHYEGLKQTYESVQNSDNKKKLADVISVMAITAGKEKEKESLKFRLLGSQADVEIWGHEYLRNLAGEIGDEYLQRRGTDDVYEELVKLGSTIAAYHMKHNSEPEAVDLLIEIDSMDLLIELADEKNCSRTCLYLAACYRFLPETDNNLALEIMFQIYAKMKRSSDALRMSIKIKDYELAEQIIIKEPDPAIQKQLAFICAQASVHLDFEGEWLGPYANKSKNNDDLCDDLQRINSNSYLPEFYQALARDLDVLEPKLPDDVYKSHLVERRGGDNHSVDSARQNMASSFVTGLVNAGFCKDKLVTEDFVETQDGSKMHWIFKNKEYGKIVAVGSIGLVNIWDVEGGLPQIDKYLYSRDPYIQGGACLAAGIICTRTLLENDPAQVLISEGVESSQQIVRLPSILGLGLAYADAPKRNAPEESPADRQFHETYISSMLSEDQYSDIESTSMLALALGMIFVGTAKTSVVETLLHLIMSKPELDLSNPFERFLPLSLGLLFLGRQNGAEATLEVIKTFDPKIRSYCEVTVESMAYAGTGDVLIVQKMLAVAGEHFEEEDTEEAQSAHLGAAVIGLALISMGEDVGSHMILRTLEHILQYGEIQAREAVPLALAVLNLSNPNMSVMDSLSRLSHDSSQTVAMNAVLGLGLIGAGTNNARLAGLLRNLSSYYYKEAQLLFLVKISQGLVHMGKGLLTISPMHLDNLLLSGCSLAGILPLLHASLSMKKTITGKHPWLVFSLACAMRPRMLYTIDEDCKLLPVSVRVGQAVDTVAQAGRPKTITGFQTHTTPVLLSAGERAELATEKYIPLTPVLEGVVILKPNPDYVELAE